MLLCVVRRRVAPARCARTRHNTRASGRYTQQSNHPLARASPPARRPGSHTPTDTAPVPAVRALAALRTTARAVPPSSRPGARPAGDNHIMAGKEQAAWCLSVSCDTSMQHPAALQYLQQKTSRIHGLSRAPARSSAHACAAVAAPPASSLRAPVVSASSIARTRSSVTCAWHAWRACRRERTERGQCERTMPGLHRSLDGRALAAHEHALQQCAHARRASGACRR